MIMVMRGCTCGCALSLAMANTMMIILSVITIVAARHEYNRDSRMGYQDITEEESQITERVNKPGACPKTDWVTGPCTETCSGDSDCEGDLKCCTVRCGKENGGRSCQKPVNENQCSIRCTKILEPVCATDGVTYGNECALREAVCSRNQGFIKSAHEGECLPTKTGPCARQYQNAIGSVLMHMTGQQIPTCDRHGFYKPMQCSGSTGACWCVKKNGKTVEAAAGVFIYSDKDCLKFLDNM